MTKIKRNFIFNMIKAVMAILFPVITFPYVSRVLGVENLGKVQYCQSVISYFSLFAGLGISNYAVREGAKIREKKSELSSMFNELLLINLITMTTAYLFLVAMIIFHFFDGYEKTLLICSLTILFTTLGVEWMNQIKEDYTYISIRSVAFQVIAIILMLIFVRDKHDYTKYAFLACFSTGGFFFLNLIHIRKYVRYGIKQIVNVGRHFKSILIIFGMSVSTSIYVNLDVVIVGAIHGDYQVGLYSVAVKLCLIIKQLSTALTGVVLSRLSFYANDGNKRDDYRRLLINSMNLNMILIIPCSIGMVMLGKEIINIFSGDQYLEALRASRVLAINLILSTIDNILCYQVLLPNNREKEATISTVMGAISNLILNCLFIPQYKIMGAAVATLLSETIVFFVLSYFSKGIVRLGKLFDQIYKFVLATIPIVCVCILFKIVFHNPLMICVSSTLTGGAVYFLLLIQMKVPLAIELMKDAKKIICKCYNYWRRT